MLFINVKDTIFESKSQPEQTEMYIPKSCLSMSKIQFLKANHNQLLQEVYSKVVVYQCQRYNFWKQITTTATLLLINQTLFINVKDTIFESKSQRLPLSALVVLVVYQCQRYNFWKQITTSLRHSHLPPLLFINVKDTIFESKSQPWVGATDSVPSCLSMSKIQFLKANHNLFTNSTTFDYVVYQCQRYNFWKQITT